MAQEFIWNCECFVFTKEMYGTYMNGNVNVTNVYYCTIEINYNIRRTFVFFISFSENGRKTTVSCTRVLVRNTALVSGTEPTGVSE